MNLGCHYRPPSPIIRPDQKFTDLENHLFKKLGEAERKLEQLSMGEPAPRSKFWPMVLLLIAVAFIAAGGRELVRPAPAYDPPRKPDIIHAQVARIQEQVRLLQSQVENLPGGRNQLEAAILDINAQLAAMQGDAGHMQDQINTLKFNTGLLPVADDGPRVRPGGDVCE